MTVKKCETQKCKFKMQILYFAQFCFSAQTGNSDSHLHENQSRTYNKSLCFCICIFVTYFRIQTGRITNSMEQSHSWEANNSSTTKKLTCTLWNLTVHHHVHKIYNLKLLWRQTPMKRSQAVSCIKMWRFSNDSGTASIPTFRVLLVAW